MKKFRKMFCLILSIALFLGTVGMSAHADETSSVIVTAVKFFSDGVEIGKLPSAGKTIGAEATSTASLALVLAAYDGANTLVCAAVNPAGNYVGGLAMSDEIQKVRLLAWNSLDSMTPILDDTYTLTVADPKNPGALESFSVNGNEASVVGNTITAYVPVWDANGEKLSSWTVKATTKENTGTITLDGETLQANTENAVNAINSGTVNVTEKGTSVSYQLHVMYQIKDNFDMNSVFEGNLTGSATTANTWEGEGIVKGSLPQNTFFFNLSGAEEYLDYQPFIRAGVQPITAATKTDGTTQIANTAASMASGNALRIGKTKALKDTATGLTKFTINNQELFSEGDAITVEYDYAVDYSKALTTGGNGPVGLNGGGIRYNGSDKYAIYDRYGATTVPLESQAQLRLSFGGGEATDIDSSAFQGYWHHIKQIFDKTSNTATTYIDGKALAPGHSLEEAGNYQTSLNLQFMTSGMRTADFWIDNLSITWNQKPKLDSMTVAGGKASIDQTNNLITVDLPLWDTTGEAIDAASVAATLTSSETIIVGNAAVTSGEETILDLSTAKKVTVGSRTYDMTINRTIYDDFDTNTVFTGNMLTASTATQGAWTSNGDNSDLVKGAAKDYIKAVWNGSADENATAISVGTLPITSALKRDKLSPIDVGTTGAKGNAVRVSKTNADGKQSAFLVVENSSLKKANSQLVVEYDMAFDYSQVTSGNIGAIGGGIRYFINDESYSFYDNTNVALSDINNVGKLAIKLNNTTLYTANGDNGKPNCPPDSWYHIRTVIDTKTKKAISYVDGKQLGGSFDFSSYWTGDRLIAWQTSGFRSIAVWVDNLSISYDVSTTK